MCGIAGYSGPLATTKNVAFLLSVTSHRGPDNSAVVECNSSTYIGHNRLAILDLNKRSNQPFEKHGLTLAYNGEIYNYKELKRQLEAKGVIFITDSDTEVVIEAWKQWGHTCLTKFRGMFAFSIYDSVTKKLYLARDHFGIKPLFYYKSQNQGFAFCSELKGIQALFANELEVNRSAIAASLNYVWVPESYCVFEGAHKLKPGHFLEYDTRTKKISTALWFDPLCVFPEQKNCHSEAQIIDELDDVLCDSIEAHLISDVPVNAFLSGGLDSSLIVAMAKQRVDLECFTMRFSERDKRFESMPDDLLYARKVATKLGVKLHELEVSHDVVNMLPEIVRCLDEPIGDAAAINTLLICRAARDNGSKVLLSGMGADELFGGYRRHLAMLYSQQYQRSPDFLRKYAVEPLVNRLPVGSPTKGYKTNRWLKRFMSFAKYPMEQGYQRSYSYFDESSFKAIVSDDLESVYADIRSEHESIFNAPDEQDLINKMCYTDTQMFMCSLNQTYTDRASMMASTEVRVPFIDIEVAKLAMSIPGNNKIKKGVSKYALKKVAERYLPKEIIYRKKASFGMPLRSWVRNELKEQVDDYLLASDGLASRGIVNQKALRQLIESDRRGSLDNAQMIWHLLTVEQWFKNLEDCKNEIPI